MSSDSRIVALAEALLVAVLTFALHAALHAMGASIAASALATFGSLAVCTWLLRRRARTWSALGFGDPTPWYWTAAWAVGLFVVEMLAPALLSTPLANALGLPLQRLDAFADLRGNLGFYLVMLIPVGWGSAAFGEELVDRGFIFNRLADAFGRNRLGIAAALVLQAALFALGHRYLGPRGMLNAGVLGLLSGLAYLLNGRKLWPLVIAHGLVDSVGLTVLYLGAGHG